MFCGVWSLVAAKMVVYNDQLFRAFSDFGLGSCADWFQSKPVMINLVHWGAIRKKDYGTGRQRNSWVLFFFFKCHKLYFLNVKSPHFRVCYVFCGISKLCLGTSYLNFSVVLSSFRIMVLGRYFAGFAPARGTQLWKPCTAKAGSISGSLPVDLGWLPFNSQLWKFWWCQHLIGF